MEVSTIKQKATYERKRTMFLLDSTRGATNYLGRLVTNMALNTKTQAILENTFSQSNGFKSKPKTTLSPKKTPGAHSISLFKANRNINAGLQTDSFEAELMIRKAERYSIEANINRNFSGSYSKDYNEEIEQRLKSVSSLSNENEVLAAEVAELKAALCKCADQYRAKKASFDTLCKAKSALSLNTVSEARRKNLALSESNRELLNAIDKLKAFAKIIIDCKDRSELHQIITENKALRELVKAQYATEPIKEQPQKSPAARELKPKANTSPSRNTKKKRRVTHIRSLSLNANQWEEIFSSNPYEDCDNNTVVNKGIGRSFDKELRRNVSLKLKHKEDEDDDALELPYEFIQDNADQDA